MRRKTGAQRLKANACRTTIASFLGAEFLSQGCVPRIDRTTDLGLNICAYIFSARGDGNVFSRFAVLKTFVMTLTCFSVIGVTTFSVSAQMRLPPGSYAYTCDSCRFDGRYLSCRCRTSDGRWLWQRPLDWGGSVAAVRSKIWNLFLLVAAGNQYLPPGLLRRRMATPGRQASHRRLSGGDGPLGVLAGPHAERILENHAD
jgi:hypothetical protein